MSKVQFSDILAYLTVSVIAVAFAAFLSLQFLKPAASQEEVSPPSSVPVTPTVPLPEQEESDLPVINPIDTESRPSFPSMESNGTADSVREVEVFLQPFLYDAKERRDPFEPYKAVIDEDSAPHSPLQLYPLQQLKLVGIMWDVKKPRAMFVDPLNEVHVAVQDDGIGKKNGYIAAIREGEVVVVEAEKTDKGISYQTKVIRLAR